MRYRVILFFLGIITVFTTNAFALLDNWSHWNLGQEALKMRDFKRAEVQFSYYLKHPEMHRHMFGIAYFGRGLTFQELGNYGRAIEEYKMAIENDLHPTTRITDKAYMNMGAIYMKTKVYQDAIKAYSKAIENNPRNGLAHYYLGLAYLRDSQYEKAEKEAEEAKKLGVTFTVLSDELNKIKNNTGKTGKAQKTD
jgi:tetratricopeptide (TPR) repeat protein